MLRELEAGIDALRLDGPEGPCDVPVKLRVHDSLFVPLAKWSMLLTGNYRCITAGAPRPIREAVHADLDRSRAIYAHVDALARRLGADAADRSEEHTSELQSLMRISYAVFCLKKKTYTLRSYHQCSEYQLYYP